MKKLRHWKLLITQKLAKWAKRYNNLLVERIRRWLGINRMEIKLHHTRVLLFDLQEHVDDKKQWKRWRKFRNRARIK